MNIKISLFTVTLIATLLTVCQQPAPPPLEGEALKQRQQEIAQESRKIVQQIRDSLALIKEPSKIDTIYIHPSDYPSLPDNISSWLKEQKYVIPQAYSQQTGNVIEGEFIVEGQIDIAILTTNFIDSFIIIFPQKSTTNALFISLFEDSKDWNVWNNSIATYRYTISQIPINDLSVIYDSQPSIDFPKPELDGIELYLVDKASSIYYLDNNEWIAIPFLD